MAAIDSAQSMNTLLNVEDAMDREELESEAVDHAVHIARCTSLSWSAYIARLELLLGWCLP